MRSDDISVSQIIINGPFRGHIAYRELNYSTSTMDNWNNATDMT